MAAEDVGKPLPHPRRCTPDHPPYAMMIGAAIQSLSEEGGSTMAAISRYIRTNFDGIPDGHDSLLHYYLSKLTAMGEFIMIAPGRFAIADDAGGEPATASSRPGHDKPTSSLTPVDDKGDDTQSPPQSYSEGPGPSKPTAHEGDVVERIESVPESEGHAQPPSDGKTLHEPLHYVLALPWIGPPVTETPLLVDEFRVGSVDLDQSKGGNDGKDQEKGPQGRLIDN